MASRFTVSVLVWSSVLAVTRSILLNHGGFQKWPGTREAIDGEEIEITKLPMGALRGRRRNIVPEAGGEAQKVDWFLGIPYAKPPTEHKRFTAPEPVESWPGLKESTKFGPTCAQTQVYPQLNSSEDCLTLNIFSPVVGSQDKLSVVVFLHGETYKAGTGASYLGHILAQQGVVVVTVNYRLGIMGFISGRNQHLPGNYGLLDQIEALKWVQENIRHFRGDPAKVTLYGNNAGAASVGILSVSPLAEGLFNQAILQGGSPLALWATHNSSVDLEDHAREAGKVFNCSGWFFSSIVQCLREVNLTEYEKQALIKQIPDNSVSGIDYRPVEDGHVIPESLTSLYESGRIQPRRVMVGVTDRQYSRFFYTMTQKLRNDPTFDRSFADGFNRTSFEKAVRFIIKELGWDSSISDVIVQEYTNWTHVDDPLENRRQFIQFLDGLNFLNPATQLSSTLAKRNIPVYLYSFNHKSAEDTWRSSETDVHYVFGGPYMNFSVLNAQGKDFSDESQDRAMSQYMMTLFADFIKHGDPSHSTSTQANKAKWNQFNLREQNYLNLNITPSMDTMLKKRGNTFWADVIPHVRGNLEQPPKPWYEPTLLVWLLVAAGGILLLIVFILAITLCVRGRKSEETI